MARKPRVKKPARKVAKKRGAPAKRRTPSALAVVVFLLLVGTAGLATWLTYSYAAPEHGDQQARQQGDATRAVMPLDLNKEGSGGQAAPKPAAKSTSNMAAKSGDGHDEKASQQTPVQAARTEDHGAAAVPESYAHGAKPKPSSAPAL